MKPSFSRRSLACARSNVLVKGHDSAQGVLGAAALSIEVVQTRGQDGFSAAFIKIRLLRARRAFSLHLHCRCIDASPLFGPLSVTPGCCASVVFLNDLVQMYNKKLAGLRRQAGKAGLRLLNKLRMDGHFPWS